MRRVMLMLAAMAVMVSLFAAAAYAANIDGTNQRETLVESDLDDNIHGRQGGDFIAAYLWNGERDVAFGNRGADEIVVDDGDGQDTAIGGRGYDECWGDPNDELDCEEENGAPTPVGLQ
jgi:hypothetical protein